MRNEVDKLPCHIANNMAYAKFLIKGGGPKVQTAIRGLLGPIFYPIDKANITGNCLENKFTVHDLCDCDHRRHVEINVDALLTTVDKDAL
jgi:hypothetical protein